MIDIGWTTVLLHGLLQSILLWAPLVDPLREDPIPNPWYSPCEIYDMWAYLLDADSRPTAEFMDLYWKCWLSKFRGGIVDQYLTTLTLRMQAVWNTIGSLPEGFPSVVEWLDDLWYRVGDSFIGFADNLTEGAELLWDLIPGPIRDGLVTWAEFLAGAPEAVQEWVEEFIADFLQMVSGLWEWYITIGQIVTDWWSWAYLQLEEMVEAPLDWLTRNLGDAWAFLVEFWNDPAGAVIVWLSPLLEPLLTFAGDCLDFWYNLWGSYAEDLAAFLADPLEFLWDRGEAWLNRRLEQS